VNQKYTLGPIMIVVLPGQWTCIRVLIRFR